MLKRVDLRKHSKNGIYAFCFFSRHVCSMIPIPNQPDYPPVDIHCGGGNTGKTPATHENALIQLHRRKEIKCTVQVTRKKIELFLFDLIMCKYCGALTILTHWELNRDNFFPPFSSGPLILWSIKHYSGLHDFSPSILISFEYHRVH